MPSPMLMWVQPRLEPDSRFSTTEPYWSPCSAPCPCPCPCHDHELAPNPYRVLFPVLSPFPVLSTCWRSPSLSRGSARTRSRVDSDSAKNFSPSPSLYLYPSHLVPYPYPYQHRDLDSSFRDPHRCDGCRSADLLSRPRVLSCACRRCAAANANASPGLASVCGKATRRVDPTTDVEVEAVEAGHGHAPDRDHGLDLCPCPCRDHVRDWKNDATNRELASMSLLLLLLKAEERLARFHRASERTICSCRRSPPPLRATV